MSWNPEGLSNKQTDAILLLLLKRMRPNLSAAELNAIRFPDGSAKHELAKILSEQFAERELKKKRGPDQS